MVNLPRGREVSGLHGVRSLFQGAILRLVRLNGLSVDDRVRIPPGFVLDALALDRALAQQVMEIDRELAHTLLSPR